MRIGLDLSLALQPSPSGTGVYADGLLHGLLEAAPPGLSIVCGYKLSRLGGRRFLPRFDDPRLAYRPFQDPGARLTLGHLDVFHGLATDLPSLLGCPKVLTIHSLHTLEPSQVSLDGPHRRARQAARVQRLVARADAVICLTEDGRRRFLARFPSFPANRTRTIPHGVDLARFKPLEAITTGECTADAETRARLGVPVEPGAVGWPLPPPPAGYVLHVAQVQRRKNTARLIRAFLRVPAARGRLLVIAGRHGFAAEEALVEAASPAAARVRFIGPVARADMPALYRGAAVLSLPSLYEEFGLPVLEAFACGVPVVASSAPALPEVTAGAALLPDSASEDEIAAALDAALTEEAYRAELRARGHGRAAALSWRACAERTLALYRDLLGM